MLLNDGSGNCQLCVNACEHEQEFVFAGEIREAAAEAAGAQRCHFEGVGAAD